MSFKYRTHDHGTLRIQMHQLNLCLISKKIQPSTNYKAPEWVTRSSLSLFRFLSPTWERLAILYGLYLMN